MDGQVADLISEINKQLQIQQPEMCFFLSLFFVLDFLCLSFFLLFFPLLVDLWWFVADLLWVGAFGCFEQHLSGLWVHEWLGVGTFASCWWCDHCRAVCGISVWCVSYQFEKKSYKDPSLKLHWLYMPGKAHSLKIPFFVCDKYTSYYVAIIIISYT